MARKTTTTKKTGARPHPRGTRRPRGLGPAPAHPELVSLVCRYFTEGRLPAEIQEIMKRDHQIRISRETPYRYLAYAAQNGWIQYVAPPEHWLRDQLQERCPWLRGVEVAYTAVFDDVAYHTAKMLVDLICAHHRSAGGRRKVHVGFAGGHGMRRVAQILADLLRRPTEGLPETVVFHALVGGFDIGEPATDPNAFFTYFVNDPIMQVGTEFVGLHVPPIVEPDMLSKLQEFIGIKEAYARAEELDIIVTSVGSWTGGCQHSLLRRYMEDSPELLRRLEEECRFDILWRPVGEHGPIETTTGIRAMTIVEPGQLPDFLGRGKSVLLALGPCRRCFKPRGEILRTLIQQREHLISHLVTDSRTVADVLRTRA